MMSPEIKRLMLDNFDFFLTFGTFLLWAVLLRSNWTIIAAGRKIILLVFTYLSFKTWCLYMAKVIVYLDRIDVDVFIRRHAPEYRGTDWVDGFLWGLAISIYAGIILLLWFKDFTSKS